MEDEIFDMTKVAGAWNVILNEISILKCGSQEQRARNLRVSDRISSVMKQVQAMQMKNETLLALVGDNVIEAHEIESEVRA